MTKVVEAVAEMNLPWWKTAVIYHIYPRSFCDSNFDGWGDLAGISRRLSYLKDLGVSAIMISPFYQSPMVDGGYDVSDHCDVDRRFGTLEDFDQLIRSARKLDIRVLIDFVANHVSVQHPWFQAVLNGVPNSEDRFIWTRCPNAWRSAIKPGSAWTYCDANELFYLHCFLKEQPDLNWRDQSTKEAMHDVLRFWLKIGVSGFRVDAAHCLMKDELLTVHECEQDVPLAAVNNQPETVTVLAEMSTTVKSFGDDRLLIGEVFLNNPDAVSQYTPSNGRGLDLTLNFSLLRCSWSSASFFEAIRLAEDQCLDAGVWPTWILSNHDQSRHRSRFGGSEGRARVCAVILGSLRGTPVLYQGEELGLLDGEIEDSIRAAPAFRVGSRAPIPWNDAQDHGWKGVPHPLSFPPESEAKNCESSSKDPNSILSLYRRIFRLRRTIPALGSGNLHDLRLFGECLEFGRTDEAGRTVWIVCNFSNTVASVPHLAGCRILAHSSMMHSRSSDGFLERETAVIVERPTGF